MDSYDSDIQSQSETNSEIELDLSSADPIVDAPSQPNDLGLPIQNNEQNEDGALFDNQNVVLNANALNGQFNDESVEFRVHSAQVWSFVVMIYLGIMSVVLTVCLSIDWNKPCGRNLKSWTIVQIILQLFMFGTKALLYYVLSFEDIANVSIMPPEQMKKISLIFFFNRSGNFLFVAWFIVGTILRFGKSSCSANVLMQCILIQFVIQWCLIGVLFLTCCCAAGIIGCIWCINPRLINPAHIRGASKSQIKKLKEMKYNPSDNLIHEDDANCAICISPYEPKEKIRFLPCNHHFHSTCVDQWLLKNKTCPFCKREIDEKTETTDIGKENVQMSSVQIIEDDDEIELSDLS